MWKYWVKDISYILHTGITCQKQWTSLGGEFWMCSIDGLAQDCGNSSAIALELPKSYTKEGIDITHHRGFYSMRLRLRD